MHEKSFVVRTLTTSMYISLSRVNIMVFFSFHFISYDIFVHLKRRPLTSHTGRPTNNLHRNYTDTKKKRLEAV